jgi:hypothetical protein
MFFFADAIFGTSVSGIPESRFEKRDPNLTRANVRCQGGAVGWIKWVRLLEFEIPE